MLMENATFKGAEVTPGVGVRLKLVRRVLFANSCSFAATAVCVSGRTLMADLCGRCFCAAPAPALLNVSSTTTSHSLWLPPAPPPPSARSPCTAPASRMSPLGRAT